MRPGLLVANRFHVRSLLGRGGMGSVWLAHHVELDMPCALKFVEGAGEPDPDTRQRFTREAKAAALLRSPHVVQIFDAGTWEDTPYLAMELLEGETLAKRLERLGRLRPVACVAVADQIARALIKAHAAGVVHRDLKPDNIFLARDEGREVVKVLDFGVAKWTLAKSGGEALTRYGAMLGTPLYMSPEQARDCRVVDHRSDLWSLAVIVFECLTGRLPFEGKRLAEVFLQILKDPLPLPSQIAPGLPLAFDGWWAKAADRDPSRRFADARELVDALALALGVTFGSSGFTDPTASLPSMTAPVRGTTGTHALSKAGAARALATSPRAPHANPAGLRARYILALSLGLGALGGIASALVATTHAGRSGVAVGASAAPLSPAPPAPASAPPPGPGAPGATAPATAPTTPGGAPPATATATPSAPATAITAVPLRTTPAPAVPPSPAPSVVLPSALPSAPPATPKSAPRPPPTGARAPELARPPSAPPPADGAPAPVGAADAPPSPLSPF